MRILLVTHRFGKDFVGGAERHLWYLAEHFARMGCEVDVASTLYKEFYPFLRFGLVWHTAHRNPIQDIHIEGAPRPIRVIRFPVKNLPKPVAALYQKHLQRRWEAEELAMEVESLQPIPGQERIPFLLTGWHLPELMGGKYARWTMQKALIRLPQTNAASLHIKGFAPKKLSLRFEQNDRSEVIFSGKGDFEVAVQLADGPASIAALHVDKTMKPVRDSRTLGILVTQISLTNGDEIVSAPFHVDHRTLRAQDKRQFIKTYLERAEARPSYFCRVFDELRGPRCPGMQNFIENNAHTYDWVLAGICPFSIIPAVMRARRKHVFRTALLPLFHVDDDFYYWQHYLDAIRMANINLANSHFSDRIFFPIVGGRSITAGAGVDDTIFRKADISGERFRKKYGFAADEKIVLSVGRKSGSKRYRMLMDAVDNIQDRVNCRLVLIGPEDDQLPIASPNCSYLGQIPENDLIDAYDACDVFSLMSESESFGMVFLEAWMREKPVIGSRECGPVANLIEEGKRGLLASSFSELEDHLVTLLSSPEMRGDMGRAGLAYGLENFTWKAITRRILDHFEMAVREQ